MEKRYYLASGAVVTGDVELGNEVSIWHNAVLRGDSGKITVGDRTNIQDGCIVHEETVIGADCTVGHGAIVHGCIVGDGCLIGMGAIVLNGAVLGDRQSAIKKAIGTRSSHKTATRFNPRRGLVRRGFRAPVQRLGGTPRRD